MTARNTAAPAPAGRDMASELAFLTRSLKAPTLREAVPRLAERARAESWTHEEFQHVKGRLLQRPAEGTQLDQRTGTPVASDLIS